MSRRREEQDILDKVILTALKKGDVRWPTLDNKVLTTVILWLREQGLITVYGIYSRNSISNGLIEESTGLRRLEKNTWR